jgi:hypothetical protein
MVGYPYYCYENENLDQGEIFMVFSLDPIEKSSKLNLTQVVYLPILGDTVKLGLSDEFTYQFCDQISEICGTLRVIDESQTLVLDYDGFCKLVSESDTIINTVSSNLGITKELATKGAQNFFITKNVIVRAGGTQGRLYKVDSYLQSAGSAGLVANIFALAKLTGVSGLQILKAQPILVVAISTTGAIFFYGCGAIIGDNTVGKVFVTAGDVLAVPMKGVEIMWNSCGIHILLLEFKEFLGFL